MSRKRNALEAISILQDELGRRIKAARRRSKAKAAETLQHLLEALSIHFHHLNSPRYELTREDEKPLIEHLEALACRLRSQSERAEDLEDVKWRLRDYSAQLSQTAEAFRFECLLTPEEAKYEHRYLEG